MAIWKMLEISDICEYLVLPILIVSINPDTLHYVISTASLATLAVFTCGLGRFKYLQSIASHYKVQLGYSDTRIFYLSSYILLAISYFSF